MHFKDRLELILAALQQSLPDMLVPLHALKESVGADTPEENLGTAIRGLLKFHDRVTPLLCSLATEPELLERFRCSLQSSNQGPHRGVDTLARYIEQEQQGGRISPQVDARTAGSVLMASCFFHIFTSQLLGSHAKFDVKRLIRFALRNTS